MFEFCITIFFWQRENLQAAFWFSILLCLKHIYLYIAPVYFVYLLRSYCFESQNSKLIFHFKRLIKLGMVVVAVFGLSFGPFFGQFQQVCDKFFRLSFRIVPRLSHFINLRSYQDYFLLKTVAYVMRTGLLISGRYTTYSISFLLSSVCSAIP